MNKGMRATPRRTCLRNDDVLWFEEISCHFGPEPCMSDRLVSRFIWYRHFVRRYGDFEGRWAVRRQRIGKLGEKAFHSNAGICGIFDLGVA